MNIKPGGTGMCQNMYTKKTKKTTDKKTPGI